MKNKGFKKKSIYLLFILFNLQSVLFTPVAHADQSVSATVPPRVTDFQFALTSPAQQTIQPNTAITYTISYGALPSAGLSTTTTIVAKWNSSVLLNYINNSASTGYGGALPVINSINKTITWTIPNLPAGVTDQTLSFKLYIASSYSQTTPFTIRASMSNQYLSLPVQSITQTYQYTTPSSPITITGTPTPTATQLAPSSPTPTPTPPLQFTSITITGISDNQAFVAAAANNPTRFSINYGTSPTSLAKTITIDNYTYQQSLTLPGLQADTTYYFRMLGTGNSGNTTTSDIFTFHTAKVSSLPNVQDNLIVLSSQGNVLTSNDQSYSDKKNPSVILTVDSNYNVAYTLVKPIPLKSIDIVVQNDVLGASVLSPINDVGEIIIPMQQKSSNLYVANLQSLTPGSYEVDVRIVDDNGNIVEKKISDLKVMPRLTVYAADTNLPLSDARIYLSYYDIQQQRYEPIKPTFFGTSNNPSYTNFNGQTNIALPAGQYRIEESALFYKKVATDFTIGNGVNQNFPVIYLKRDFSPLSFLIFIKDYLSDSWTKLILSLHILSTSIRIFHLIAVAIIVAFIFLDFLLLLLRTHIHFKHVPTFLQFHMNHLFNNHRQKFIYGNLIDEDNKPLSRVLIEVEDANKKTILAETKSNKSGRFYFKNMFTNPVNLLVTKEGFVATMISLENENYFPENGIKIVVKKNISHHINVFFFLVETLEEIAGLFFEVTLVFSIILELLFLSIYGIERTAVYLFLSFINILLWLFYLREKK